MMVFIMKVGLEEGNGVVGVGRRITVGTSGRGGGKVATTRMFKSINGMEVPPYSALTVSSKIGCR